MRSYANILTKVYSLLQSMIHWKVMEDIQTLMNEKHHKFAKGLKVVFQ